MTMKSALASVYLFKDLNDAEVAKVTAIATEQNYNAGDEIFMTGESASSFYIITMGSVKIYANSDGDSLGIANMGTGSHFGELPFYDHGRRSATAQTLETTRILEIKYADLETLLETNPGLAVKVYRSGARFMAVRLRATLEDLNHARETRLKHF